jgi:diadenylate cyclase
MPMDILEIIILVIMIYQIQKSLKNTRAWMIIKGIVVLVIVYLCASILGLTVIEAIFQGAISLCVIAVIILFEPEIKKFLEELGTHKIKDILKIVNNKEPIVNKRYSDETIKSILDACSSMSEAKTGALIIIEQDSLLNEYINTGIPVNADISSQLILNIFEHNTPLHDGAVIIKKDKIVAATCYLPLSDNTQINKKLGTRHRAGIGLSEVTDALVIIVSEETGKISFVRNGDLKHGVSIDVLHNLLNEYQSKEETLNTTKILKSKTSNIKRNFGSKILSLIFGIFVWIAVINSQDPLTTKTYEVPVTITNENSLTLVGKTYDVAEGESVSVNVTAARSIINSLNNDDIVAIADLKKLSYTYSVPIEASIPSLNSSEYEIDTNNANLILSLDELVELNIDVQIEQEGNCRSGYGVYSLSSNTKEISISGGESIIKTIDKAIVTVNVSGQKEDFTDKYDIVVYDKNGNIIDNELLTLSESTIIVNANIMPLKNIPINVSLLNESGDNYKLINQEADLSNIIVTGLSEDLKDLTELNIDLDIANEPVSETYIKTLNIEDYLPEGVYLQEKGQKINITMQFDIYVTKDYEVNVNKINVNNLNEKLKVEFTNNTFKLTFKGKQEDIDAFNISSLKYSIDADNLTRGSYNLPVDIENLPTNLSLVSDKIVPFSIVKE